MTCLFRYLFLTVILIESCLSSVWAASSSGPLGGLVDFYSWPQDDVNLVKNPSFEDIDADGNIVGWENSDPDRFSSSMTVARSGKRSIRFRDSNLSKKLALMQSQLSLAPGWYSMRGWIKAEGAGTNKRRAGGRVNVWWKSGWAASSTVQGDTDWTAVERSIFEIPAETTTWFKLEGFRKPNGTLFFDDIEVRRLIPPVMEGFLRYPNYRGVLFDDGPQVIRLSVVVRPEEVKIPLSALTVRLRLCREGHNEAVVAKEISPSALSFEIALDAKDVSVGTYTLKLEAVQRESDKTVFVYPSYRIVKLPAETRKKMQAYIDHENVLVLGGKRSFALGIYDTTGFSQGERYYERRISKIAEAPFNLYINYWLGQVGATYLTPLLSVLQQHSMFYLHTVNSWYNTHKRWPGSSLCKERMADELGQEGFTACRAEELGNLRALAGWYTADELRADQVERVFRQYKTLKQYDTDGVTFIAQNKPREIGRWRDAADVMGVDPYPIYNIPEGQLSPLERVSDWISHAQQGVESSRPVWGVIQFFKFGSKGHWPTYEELRSMSYLAIVAGAKGLFYWSYGAKGLAWVKDRQRKEELWQRLVRVTKEIKELEPALLSRDAPEILAEKRGEDVRVLAKQVGSTRYIIAVNSSPREAKATFILAGNAKTISVIGEERTVPIQKEQTFIDHFTPYATHIYVIKESQEVR